MSRTHHCSQLRKADVGGRVRLAGWVNARRDHGGVIFVDLRDREGITQVVFNPQISAEAAKAADALRAEFVIEVHGKVVERLAGTVNASLPTGEVEVQAERFQVINSAGVPPFPLDERIENEDLRLQYRYLDLRRPQMQQNLRMRHKITQIVRNYLTREGFIEIETPMLFKSTAEGAREFLVPSRPNPGKFYALPQSPQQYKQLLMVAGFERYFQIARCFRDEDQRADRQPEFTQIDIEASFISQEDIIRWTEGFVVEAFEAARGVKVPTPFPRMTFAEAMNRYGSDKPDTRFGLELADVTAIFKESGFKVFQAIAASGGTIKALNAKKFAGITSGQLDALTQTAVQHGAKGLAFIKIEGGEWKSPIVKFFSDAERTALRDALKIEEGDLILFSAGEWEPACAILGRVRLKAAELQSIPIDPSALNFLWVLEFPLLERDEENNKWKARHHPFTRPHADDVALLEKGEYAKVRAVAHDIVLNGFELGGGSMRIHEPELQAKLFSIIGLSAEKQQAMFGHLLQAFSFGTPPHGGIAPGLDRLVMLACGEENIREVIAFPKNNRAQELMTGSPSEVDARQLRDLHLKIQS